MSTPPNFINRHSVFVSLVGLPGLSNRDIGIAKLPPPEAHPSAGWRPVRSDILRPTKPINHPTISQESAAFGQLKPTQALEQLKGILSLQSVAIGNSLEYQPEEHRLALPPEGALALAIAVQFLPEAVSNCAGVMKAILQDGPLPKGATSEQIGNALLLFHLAAHGPESILSLFGIPPAGWRWLSERTTITAPTVQQSMQLLQINYARALYHGSDVPFL